jgi:hypothetical protein
MQRLHSVVQVNQMGGVILNEKRTNLFSKELANNAHFRAEDSAITRCPCHLHVCLDARPRVATARVSNRLVKPALGRTASVRYRVLGVVTFVSDVSLKGQKKSENVRKTKICEL